MCISWYTNYIIRGLCFWIITSYHNSGIDVASCYIMTMKCKSIQAKYWEGDCIFDLITSMEIIFIGALLYLGRDKCFLFSYPTPKQGEVIINVGRLLPKYLLVSSDFK